MILSNIVNPINFDSINTIFNQMIKKKLSSLLRRSLAQRVQYINARDFWSARKRKTAFSLTATTGAGKTVMAAAVFEALLGSKFQVQRLI